MATGENQSEMVMRIDRGQEYGPVEVQSRTFQGFLNEMRGSPRWNTLTSIQQQSMIMIALKLSRILVGNPKNVDSWIDIAGYARLGAPQHPVSTAIGKDAQS